MFKKSIRQFSNVLDFPRVSPALYTNYNKKFPKIKKYNILPITTKNTTNDPIYFYTNQFDDTNKKIIITTSLYNIPTRYIYAEFCSMIAIILILKFTCNDVNK